MIVRRTPLRVAMTVSISLILRFLLAGFLYFCTVFTHVPVNHPDKGNTNDMMKINISYGQLSFGVSKAT